MMARESGMVFEVKDQLWDNEAGSGGECSLRLFIPFSVHQTEEVATYGILE